MTQSLFFNMRGVSQNRLTISDKSQVHHIKNVLRMQKGEALVVMDETGRQHLCEIESLSEKQVNLCVKEKQEKRQEGPAISVACAIPKKARMDDIIDKLTQLGVARIIPLVTEHTIVRLDKAKEGLRHERWKRIAKSASEQSHRISLPAVSEVKTFREFLSEAGDFDLKLIPTLEGKRLSLGDVLKRRRPKHILVAIGPEGDFSNGEVALARRQGFVPVSLGERVLRVDTAALAVASFIALKYENR